ncbi:rod shape-determining protein MreD [Salinisphaera sp. PC39]|uniref:rod shape-determining protein MreD n=1 Tax=Salinisphaera sp. PC39 TaxID=1304156 RepID=UPI00333E8735
MNPNIAAGPLLIAGSLALSLILMLVPLPTWAAMARPAFLPATVLFWAMVQPQRFGVIAAWGSGLLMDVVYTTPLGQHGLALAVCAYAVFKLKDLLLDFPAIQQSVVLLPLFLVYEFILFWIDGVNGRSVDPLWRWLPALSTAVVWPLWTLVLERMARPEVS